MPERLLNANKVVGIKQLRRAIRDGRVETVFLAENVDPWISDEVYELALKAGLVPVRVATMQQLGQACGISVGAATAAILK